MSTSEQGISPDTQALPPEAVMIQMILGFMATQAVYVAAKLGLADLVKDGVKRSEELAQATDTDASSLYRVLRTLSGLGVFAEDIEGRFSLTPLSRLLLTDTPGSMRDMAIYMGEGWHLHPWQEILYSVKTGRPSVEKVFGMDIFPWFEQHPEEASIFNNAMTSFSAAVAPAVVATYDFSSINKLVDVAGGHGYLLATILKANPHLTGVLFDQASVIKGALQQLEAQGVADRCQTVSGNFFEAVPEGADAYIMKHIIHDWDDERSLKILKNIHRAMKPEGKLLLVESVLPPKNEPSPGKLVDLEMLIYTGGRERTADEYRNLFASAGFELTRVVENPSPLWVVEGTRV
jgi:SAM-dependent methyltransferase